MLEKKQEFDEKLPFDLCRSLSLVPSFNELDAEDFFKQFERTVIHFKWPQEKWVWLNRFTGKAAQVFNSLEEYSYELVKTSILNAYSVTP